MTLLTPTDRAFKTKQQVVHDVLVELQSNKHGVVDIGLLLEVCSEMPSESGKKLISARTFLNAIIEKRKDRH